MHIEIKKNQIIIEFSEEETRFIEQKVGGSEVENISNYIKGKLIKALSLEGFEKDGSANVGKDFSLNKIKKVTAELKKSNYKSDKAAVIGDSDENESDTADEISAEIGDELLSDLLDRDLLKNLQKPKKDSES